MLFQPLLVKALKFLLEFQLEELQLVKQSLFNKLDNALVDIQSKFARIRKHQVLFFN